MNNATSTGAAPTAGTILTYNTHATGLVSPQGAGSLVGCTVSDTRLVTPPGNITPTFGCISANASDTFTIFFGAFTELPPPAPATIAWIK
jgi:hypothetical protein